MAPFHINEVEILVFGLALLRVSTFFMTWPVFSQFSVPQHVKILFSVAVTFCIFAVIPRNGLVGQTYDTGLFWLATKEVLIGLLLGFVSRLLFYAVECGGHLMAVSMGLASATVFSPATGQSTPVLEKFYVVLLTLLFLGLNAHHTFISAMVESFTIIPISPTGIDLAAFSSQRGGGEMIQAVTVSGLKMAAPIMCVIFFLNVAMGIIGRAVPQINVLVTSLPVNIMAGLMVMIVTLPALVVILDRDMVSFTDIMFRLMRSL
ncbi:flagellar biosynthetic protein FliR [soil metagenome]